MAGRRDQWKWRVCGPVGQHIGQRMHEGGEGERGKICADLWADLLHLGPVALGRQRVDRGSWIRLVGEEHVRARTFAGVIRVAVCICERNKIRSAQVQPMLD